MLMIKATILPRNPKTYRVQGVLPSFWGGHSTATFTKKKKDPAREPNLKNYTSPWGKVRASAGTD